MPDPANARGRSWWLPAFGAVLGAAVFLLVRDSLTDDGYISLAYAKNLAVHGEWGLVPGSPANSATSPLNVLLLGALTFVTRVAGGPHPVVALGVLTVFCGGVLGWAWQRFGRVLTLPPAAGVLGVALVLLNPFVLSAVGLEVLLIPAVLLVLTVFALEGRPRLFGVAAGLAVLTRLDLVVFVVVIALSTPAIRRRPWPAAGWAVLTTAPWFAVSWVAFGSFVPDTLVIKQLQAGVFAPWSFSTGPLMYYLGWPVTVLVSFLPALLGVIALAGWAAARFGARWPDFPALGPPAALGAGGILHYLAYSFLGVGPFHWYYVAPVTAAGTFGVAAFGVWYAQARQRRALRPGPPVLALGLTGAVLLSGAAVDVAQGVPWPSPVVFGNWASARDYASVGTQLGARLGGASVAGPGEIGTLAYFCDCVILDEFSDRGQAVGLVEKRIATAGPLMRLALRINYHWLDRSIPPRRADYRLVYGTGPATGPDSWQVQSAAKGVGHFTLSRVP
ncbi:hypothetical protein SAMN04489730_5684 [Amycolatopsis australiensis]|uniref:4-amino-4-deoxy-L-arabinose transferase n=2 Tax=Amycolatopsis australiensis TaxID=546364 RepID=A0A1K1SH01_9PSEU|nr:hypothetical protein [Amycolatopsis australiensis]SFW83649.1 hypothetical protein SAMN04489730_5684 [Amycolatopsis australiensis]